METGQTIAERACRFERC